MVGPTSVDAGRALLEVPEPEDRSGCLSCRTARCCVHFDPELTGFDLLRIATAHGMPPGAVARLRPAHAVQAGADGVRLGPGPETWLVCLRSRASTAATAELDAGGRPCLQLEDVSPGVRRCRLYHARPMRCRTFPTELGPAGVEVDTPEAICPPGAWTRDRTDLPTTRLLHLRAVVERSVHRAVLSIWNAKVAALDEAPPRPIAEARFWERLLVTHERVLPALAPLFASPAELGRLGDRWAEHDREEAPLADPLAGPALDDLSHARELAALVNAVRASLAAPHPRFPDAG